MTTTLDFVITALGILTSAVALYVAIRKQKPEEKHLEKQGNKLDKEGNKLDADTIARLYQTLAEQDDRHKLFKAESDARYNELSKRFEDYKDDMTEQLAEIVNENGKLRKWAKRLGLQLEQANIVPAAYEQ